MTDSLETRMASYRREDRSLWQQPEEYDLGNKSDRAILHRKLDSNQVAAIIDRVDLIIDDLFTVEYPDQEQCGGLHDEFVDAMAGQGAVYGRWFYYPWSQELVHFPTLEDHRRLRTARNKNLITEEEQETLYKSAIAVFGLSVGSNVVSKLVLSGIGGKLILADPDIIEPTNMNRIEGGFGDVGSYKVDIVAKKISEADPYIDQVHIKGRVDNDALEWISTEHKPDLMVDEVDDLKAKISIRKEGQRTHTPVIMSTDTGDKAVVDVERYDLCNTPLFNGRLRLRDIEGIESEEPSAIKKAVPKLNGLKNATPRLIESFLDKDKTLSGIPQLGITATIGGALAAITARELLLGRKVASGRYVFSPKETLHLKSPTSLTESAQILRRFMKESKR